MLKIRWRKQKEARKGGRKKGGRESLLQNRNQRLEIQRRAKKVRLERLQDETERERETITREAPGNVGYSDKVPSWPDIRHPQFGSTGYWCPPSVLMWVPMLSHPLSTLSGTPILGKGGGGWGGQGAGPEGWGEAATPTSLRAEAILLVAVVVLGGAAPAVAVRAALGGAAFIGCALEAERELAGLSVGVATHGEQGWGVGERGEGCKCERPPPAWPRSSGALAWAQRWRPARW